MLFLQVVHGCRGRRTAEASLIDRNALRPIGLLGSYVHTQTLSGSDPSDASEACGLPAGDEPPNTLAPHRGSGLVTHCSPISQTTKRRCRRRSPRSDIRQERHLPLHIRHSPMTELPVARSRPSLRGRPTSLGEPASRPLTSKRGVN